MEEWKIDNGNAESYFRNPKSEIQDGRGFRNLCRLDLNPHLTIEVIDEMMGKLGYVVIDRSVHGAASGGVRFAADISLDELASLARSMTYKWAFLNVPMGGAKAGIFADPHQLDCDRTELMEAFGRAIAPLVRQGVYYPGVDLGTTLNDLSAIMRGAGQPLTGQQIDASLGTGLTVFEAIRQAARFKGLELSGLRVAIEGFGKVASIVAELLTQAGSQLVALSTVEGTIVAEDGLDVSRLLTLKQQHGDRLVYEYRDVKPIARDAVFTQWVDVLIPGARPYAIHIGNVEQIRASLITPISNAPITPEAEQILTSRGVVVMPDFVTNCGGVLASNLASNGFNIEDGRRIVEDIFAKVVTGILQKAHRESQSVGEIARAVAWQNHQALNEPAPPASNKITQVSRVLKDQGLSGIWRRLAWRIYHRWPCANGAVHRAAANQFAEWGLGVTLSRITVPPEGQVNGNPI